MMRKATGLRERWAQPVYPPLNLPSHSKPIPDQLIANFSSVDSPLSLRLCQTMLP